MPKKPVKLNKDGTPSKRGLHKRKKVADPELIERKFADLSKLGRDIKPEDLDGIPRAELESLLTTVTELENRQLYNSIDGFFPDTGRLRRELYKPHVEFFKQGATKRIRTIRITIVGRLFPDDSLT